jgi:hypothetical protein
VKAHSKTQMAMSNEPERADSYNTLAWKTRSFQCHLFEGRDILFCLSHEVAMSLRIQEIEREVEATSLPVALRVRLSANTPAL